MRKSKGSPLGKVKFFLDKEVETFIIHISRKRSKRVKSVRDELRIIPSSLIKWKQVGEVTRVGRLDQHNVQKHVCFTK